MRGAAALLLVLCSAGLGLGRTVSMALRCRALMELDLGLGLLKTEIVERGSALPESCRRLAETAPGAAGALFQSLTEQLPGLGERRFAALWEEALRPLGLETPEREALLALAPVLGRCAAQEQGKELERCRETLRSLEREARRETGTAGKTSLGLGLSLGAMLAVLLL